MNAYWLSCNIALSFDFVTGVLDGSKAIDTWVSPYPCSAILLSRLSLNELTAVLHTHFGQAWFILIELNAQNSNGWLPGEFWEQITDPQAAWSKKIFGNLLPQPEKKTLLEGRQTKNALLDLLTKKE